MGTTSNLLTGLAQLIAAAVPGIVFNVSGVYTAGQTGIVFKVMPAAPDRVVVLTSVNQGDDISMPLGQIMVQARYRGAPNLPLDVDDLGDSVFDELHGKTGLIFGQLAVIQINRRVSVPMGMDASKRWERIDQFYLDVDFPPTITRPIGGSW